MSADSNTEVTFMILDDHPAIRMSIRLILEHVPNWRVTAECEDPDVAIESLANHTPDYVILDLIYRDGTGIEFLQHLRQSNSDVIPIVYTVRNDPHFALRCIRLGSKGYISKDESVNSVLKGIRQIIEGRLYVTPAIGEHLIEGTTGSIGSNKFAGVELLSNRELEVLQLIGQGKCNDEIAAAFNRSIKTIETYRHRIKRKLNLGNAIELAQVASRYVEGFTNFEAR